MNIFILDDNIQRCAAFHCDQHVVKMILESTQILCTALNKKGVQTPYKPTHLNHPCVLWVEVSWSNFRWLAELTLALNSEYRFRFEKMVDHKSIAVLKAIRKFLYEDKGLTPFAQTMPEKYKIPGNAVLAYRNYYIGKKLRFARWSKRTVPEWAIAQLA
ncbi:MAG: hypothetical protein Kow0037_29020 [Calditrichia bacterium]